MLLLYSISQNISDAKPLFESHYVFLKLSVKMQESWEMLRHPSVSQDYAELVEAIDCGVILQSSPSVFLALEMKDSRLNVYTWLESSGYLGQDSYNS